MRTGRGGRGGRSVLVGLLVLVLLFGLGGAQPSPGSGGPEFSLGEVRTWLRDSLAFDAWSGLLGSDEAPAESTAELALPRDEVAPVGEVAPEPERVAELAGRATETTRFWRLSDGRVEAEVSAVPERYRDQNGKLHPIDTTVVPADRDGMAYQNITNAFGSHFGDGSDRLVRFELDGRSVGLGLPGAARPVAPTSDGNTVTFADALGAGVDVRYRVSGQLLKEEIVLAGPPAGAARFGFRLDLEGLSARQLPDGSIGFYPGDRDVAPLLVMPPPFMFDSADVPDSPYGSGWSPAVTQTLERDADGQLSVVVEADREWLADPGRVYPVVVDPTLKIQPPVNQAQDAMILSEDPDTNFDGNWRLSAGTTNAGLARSVVQFDLSGVPGGTQLDAAELQMYFDQEHTTADFDVPLEIGRVTAPWSESTVTWNSIAGSIGPRKAGTVVQVDDSETDKVAVVGEWPASGSSLRQYAVNQNYHFNNSPTGGDTFTWVPTLPAGDRYSVQAHFVARTAGLATAAPYTVHHADGQRTVLVDQTAGGGGVWADLGAYRFEAGSSHKVVLGDVPGSAVIADAV